MSTHESPKKRSGLLAEIRVVCGQGRAVWKTVSRRRRVMFLLTTVLMFVSAACNMGVMLWLGGMVDYLQGVRSSDWLSSLPLYLGGLTDIHQWANTQDAAIAPDSDTGVRIATVFILMIAAAYLIREALKVIRKCTIENTCTQIEKETLVKLVSHLLRVDLTTLSADRVGALHGRIHRSVEGFAKFLKLAFTDFLPALLVASFAIMGAVLVHPMIALLMAGVIPVSLLITCRQVMSQKGIRLELMKKRESLDGTVVEQLGGIEYIRAANTLPLEMRRVDQAAEERRTKEISHHYAMSMFDAAKSLNEGFFYILTISASIYLAVTSPDVSFGAIVKFTGLYLGVMAPLREVHRILDDAHESSLRVAELLRMMEYPLDQSFRLPTIHRPEFDDQNVPAIVIDNLTVDYRTPDGRVRPALKGISTVIQHGEIIGVAGASASGKSTWLKVVMRLVHPTSGRVVLGGEPIESVSREVIGDSIGYVSQTPFVFSGTIAENIAYGCGDVSQVQIEIAAKQACIHDEIIAMPRGYDAIVSEQGKNLSGGQRQRFSLARVFLKNPPLLILDEGTSALDNRSERIVQKALLAARKDRTVIMVAHRLTTLRDTNRILVFDAGRIVEEGSYNELMQSGGVFAELLESTAETTPGNATRRPAAMISGCA